MIYIYNVKVCFDSRYNAGVKHSLSVYTLKNKCGGIFTPSVRRYFMCLTALGPFFHFKASFFSFCLLRLHFCDAQSMNIVGQSKLQTDSSQYRFIVTNFNVVTQSYNCRFFSKQDFN